MKLWNEALFVKTLVVVAFIVGAIGGISWMYLSTAADPLYLYAMMSIACMLGAIGLDMLARKKGVYEKVM